MSSRPIQPGDRFGAYTVLYPVKSRKWMAVWRCQCDCGNVRDVYAKNLKSGNSTSCGCLSREKTRQRNLIDNPSKYKTRQPILERFLKFVVVEEGTGCWLWTGATKGHMGYGNFNFDGTSIAAHRASWLMFRGDIPNGLFVCHHCDVPTCVNPDHLWLGSAKDNNRDRDAKGRQKTQKGERNWRSKLTSKAVLEIKDLLKDGSWKLSEIAKKYGVSLSAISSIKHGRNWKDGG